MRLASGFVSVLAAVMFLLFLNIAWEEYKELSVHDAMARWKACAELSLCEKAEGDERKASADRCEHASHLCNGNTAALNIVHAFHRTLFSMLPTSLASFVEVVTGNTLFYSIAIVVIVCVVVVFCALDRVIARYTQTRLQRLPDVSDVEARKKQE